MTPIPNKGFFDPEPTDSIEHHKERAAQIKEASKTKQEELTATEEKQKDIQADRDKAARQQEIDYLSVQAGIVREGETRDMLLERIRKLREVKVEEPKYIGRNEELQKQFEAEQAAGRAAVARAEAEEAKLREMRARIEEEDRKRLGTMEQVYRPNEMEPKATPDMKRLKK